MAHGQDTQVLPEVDAVENAERGATLVCDAEREAELGSADHAVDGRGWVLTLGRGCKWMSKPS